MAQAVQKVVTVAVLPVVESSVKATVSKSVNSPAWIDSLAASVSGALREQLVDHFRRLFVEALVPAVEQATRLMMAQMHETVARLPVARDTASGDQWRTELLEEQHKLRTQMNRIEEHQTSMQRTLADALSAQHDLLRELQTSLAASSPVSAHRSVAEMREEIERLLRIPQTQDAFAMALSSARPELVTWLCQRLDPGVLFTPLLSPSTRPLSSPVLLSLVQQLSVLLSLGHAPLAYKWLQHALPALDVKDPTVVSHIPSVMAEMVRHIDDHVASSAPTDPFHPVARLIRHIAKGLAS